MSIHPQGKTMGKGNGLFGKHWYNLLQVSMENLSSELENDLLLKGRKETPLSVEGKYPFKSACDPMHIGKNTSRETMAE